MPMYICEICNTEIQNITAGTYHFIRGWVKTGTNSDLRRIEKLHIYAHAICVQTVTATNNQDTLF